MLGLRTAGGSDVQVQGTNDDAQVSKLSCAKLGYFKDDYIQYFVRKSSRRSPLINRGYFSRYAALRQLLLKFLSQTKASGLPSQVLVLGAGFDTTWFQLAAEGQQPDRYLEVDFKEVTARKVAIINQTPSLVQALHTANGITNPSTQSAHSDAQHTGTAASQPAATTQPAMSHEPGGDMPAPHLPNLLSHKASSSSAAAVPNASTGPVQLHPEAGQLDSPCYNVVPVDLRDGPALAAAVAHAGFDTSAPTYILSECVMVYMEPEHSSAVVRWLAETFKSAAALAIYEQVKPDDAFGRQMVANLEMRGCPLKGLLATPSLEAHCSRLVRNGWGSARSWDMDTLYKAALEPSDRARIERLEVFDEFEEWHMIQEHYSISLGINAAGGGVSPPGLLSELGFQGPCAAQDSAARN